MDNEERFKQDIIPGDLLNRTINWIQENFKPEDVFTQNALDLWAKNNVEDILVTRKENIEIALKAMCSPENQPHQFIDD